MSFDLYFFKHKNSKVSEEDLAAYLTENLITEYNNQWIYENPDTGTYFTIERAPESNETDKINEPENFEDFINLNFYFYINFFRPSFFGLETFPIIDQLVQELDLYVLNPQDQKFADSPQKFPNGALLESWITSNKQVSMGPHENFSLEFMSQEKSDYLWWYQFHKIELENIIKEDIYIPNIFIVKNKEDNLLYTACAWTNHIPTILPVVDYVIIQKKYKKLFRTVEESGIVSYKLIIEKLGRFFNEFEFTVPGLKILQQAQADQMSKEFNSLEIYKSIHDFGTDIAKDGFVNVPQ